MKIKDKMKIWGPVTPAISLTFPSAMSTHPSPLCHFMHVSCLLNSRSEVWAQSHFRITWDILRNADSRASPTPSCWIRNSGTGFIRKGPSGDSEGHRLSSRIPLSGELVHLVGGLRGISGRAECHQSPAPVFSSFQFSPPMFLPHSPVSQGKPSVMSVRNVTL